VISIAESGSRWAVAPVRPAQRREFCTSGVASTDRGVTWRSFGPPLAFPPTMTYSAARNAVYIAYKECDLTVPTQPVAAQSVMRLDLTTTT
jgi:hypothetical protein